MNGRGNDNAIRPHVPGIIIAAALFVLLTTVIVASDVLLPFLTGSSELRVGQVAEENILSPFSITFESEVLTELDRLEAASEVAQVYDPPDPNVSRTRSQLARQVLDYIRTVRQDVFSSVAQRADDLQHVTALTLDAEQIDRILNMSGEAWESLDGEIINVLERIMREPIRNTTLEVVRARLPTQVSIRFSSAESEIIVAIVEDLVRPNTFPNETATEAAREAAVAAVDPVERTFALNEVVVRQNEQVTAVDMEALRMLGLLQTESRSLQEVGKAFSASLLVLALTSLYILRFERGLLFRASFSLLLAVLFLVVLAGARLVQLSGLPSGLYLFPTAALPLLYVAIASPRMALIATINLSFLLGLVATGSLELAMLTIAGGLMGQLTLRSTDRLHHFFLSGLVVALANMLVATVFNLGVSGASLTVLLPYSLANGVLAAALAIAGMYLLTLFFNFPTSLKLAELSQPGQPLLRRLMRDAPGTYQHSLQVANLSEQAALAIGADAEQVRVAAMYHDIGKIPNAAFFSENQQYGAGNAHDLLGDPERSADIIISHVSDGEALAREYHLPGRLRDYICEHHGTTEVYVFWRKAVEAAGGDESAVDDAGFHYPGPRPRSRETAVMMLADSCESAVRSIGPTSREQVTEIVLRIVEDKMNEGQLDDSGLTLNDIRTIQHSLAEMLQAVYHPRIDYQKVSAAAPAIAQPAAALQAQGPAEAGSRPLAALSAETPAAAGFNARPRSGPLPEVPELPHTERPGGVRVEGKSERGAEPPA